jgi:hypothetical protein
MGFDSVALQPRILRSACLERRHGLLGFPPPSHVEAEESGRIKLSVSPRRRAVITPPILHVLQ